MKRLFILLSFFALVGLNCQAQIQNKIYDFVLGQTTKNEVKNYFISRPDIKIYEDSANDVINASDMKFGGFFWDFAHFEFYKGVLEQVMFTTSSQDGQTSKSEIKSNWETLKTSLTKKYSSYKVDNLSVDKKITFSDGKTFVLLNMYEENGRNLLLQYGDVDLTIEKDEGEENEL